MNPAFSVVVVVGLLCCKMELEPSPEVKPAVRCQLTVKMGLSHSQALAVPRVGEVGLPRDSTVGKTEGPTASLQNRVRTLEHCWDGCEGFVLRLQFYTSCWELAPVTMATGSLVLR